MYHTITADYEIENEKLIYEQIHQISSESKRLIGCLMKEVLFTSNCTFLNYSAQIITKINNTLNDQHFLPSLEILKEISESLARIFSQALCMHEEAFHRFNCQFYTTERFVELCKQYKLVDLNCAEFGPILNLLKDNISFFKSCQ